MPWFCLLNGHFSQCEGIVCVRYDPQMFILKPIKLSWRSERSEWSHTDGWCEWQLAIYVCKVRRHPRANYSTCMHKWCWVSNFLNLFLLGKGTGKKRSLAQEWTWTGVWCIADHCLCHRANGALAAQDCKFGSYTVDCCIESWLQRETMAIRDIWRKPTDSGITRLYSFS